MIVEVSIHSSEFRFASSSDPRVRAEASPKGHNHRQDHFHGLDMGRPHLGRRCHAPRNVPSRFPRSLYLPPGHDARSIHLGAPIPIYRRDVWGSNVAGSKLAHPPRPEPSSRLDPGEGAKCLCREPKLTRAYSASKARHRATCDVGYRPPPSALLPPQPFVSSGFEC
jgi:hypothetical protein